MKEISQPITPETGGAAGFQPMTLAPGRVLSVALLFCILLAGGLSSLAQVALKVDSTKNWIGYMNVFQLPENGGGYVYGSVWNTDDLTAYFTGPTNVLGPTQLILTANTNQWHPEDPFWVTNSVGNKQMAAVFYIDQGRGGDLLGKTVNFSGTVNSNTFVPGYSVTAFVKVLDPNAGYSTVARQDDPITSASTSFNVDLDLTLITSPTLVPQYGFEVIGRNIDPQYVATTGLASIAVENPDPLFTTQPVGGTFSSAATVQLSAAAIGTSEVNYQWQKGGVDLEDSASISGASTETLMITGALPEDSGIYTVTATDTAGSTVSDAASVTVQDVVIASLPENQRVEQGSTVVFAVEATSASPLSYQWKSVIGGMTNNLTDGPNVSGATTNTLTLSNVQVADSGTYLVAISPGGEPVEVGAELLVKSYADFANSLENPGFEDDPNGVDESPWVRFESTDPGFGYFQDANDTYFGGGNVNVFEGTYVSFTSFNAAYSGIYQDVVAEPGQIFTADMWFYNASGDPLPGGPGSTVTNESYLEVQFRDDADQVIQQYVTDFMDYTAPRDVWFNLRATKAGTYGNNPPTMDAKYLIAPAGTVKVRFQLTMHDIANSTANGSLYYDSAHLLLKIPAVLSVGVAEGNVNLSWKTQGATSYQVQYKDNLNDPTWRDLEVVAGDGTVITKAYPATGTLRLYRVLTL